MQWSVIVSGISEFVTQQKLASSVILLVLLLAIKRVGVSLMRKHSHRRGEDRRHQINLFKQLYNACVLVILLLFWSAEVQEFAFSIAAFTVAIVLATKEFIQCFLGFVYYLGARPFRVGDWVQLHHLSSGTLVTGDVVEIDWAKVTLLEVDSTSFEYTGKHLYIPNSQLITQTVKNMNFLRRYSIHGFELTVEPDWELHLRLDEITRIAGQYCAHFHDIAERYKGLIERHLDTEFIQIEPAVTLHTNKFAKPVIGISLFCPTPEALQLQQAITLDILRMRSDPHAITDNPECAPQLVSQSG